MTHAPATGSRCHLLIAGTGRTGTSALVQYLDGVGLETHLSRPEGAKDWHDAAQAGFEDLPFPENGRDPPYVIKWPWAYQVIDQILEDPRIKLDAVLIPMRNLVEATASRSIMQFQAIHQTAAWMTEIEAPWQHWGTAEGGAIFSVNPLDQARLLAVGFHQLVWRLTHADVPTVLISYPRFLSDPDYLFNKIASAVPVNLSIAQAREVHAAIFDPEKARTERELNGSFGPTIEPDGPADASLAALDNIALKRELKRLRSEIEALQNQRMSTRARNMIRRFWRGFA